MNTSGADWGFQVRGGGSAFKKIAPSGGRCKKFWGISCEKSYFFQSWREAQICLGYFVWKITILSQKIIIFPILGGAHTRSGVCFHLDPPLDIRYASSLKIVIRRYVVFPNEGYLPHVSLEFFLWVFSCATQ